MADKEEEKRDHWTVLVSRLHDLIKQTIDERLTVLHQKLCADGWNNYNSSALSIRSLDEEIRHSVLQAIVTGHWSDLEYKLRKLVSQADDDKLQALYQKLYRLEWYNQKFPLSTRNADVEVKYAILHAIANETIERGIKAQARIAVRRLS
ncbi:MAG: hypothetical protein Q8L10_04380 [Candidatus Moranbacteria bacterium]|nr:hypothetical protein [Candidatus Moranbacteria bacterium]